MSPTTAVTLIEQETNNKICFKILWLHSSGVQSENELEVMPALEALIAGLQKMVDEKQLFRVEITGHYGHNVSLQHRVDQPVRHYVRALYRHWHTQAVQAQAAMFRQRVETPALESPSE